MAGKKTAAAAAAAVSPAPCTTGLSRGTLVSAAFALALAVCSVYVGVRARDVARTLFNADMGWPLLSAFEKRLRLYSEQAFYYSYYEPLANRTQTPSLLDGVAAYTSDATAEYPKTLNALMRFNIYPEIVIASLFRALPPAMVSADPIDFMMAALIALAGLQWGTFFAAASYIGRSLLSGALALAFVIVHAAFTTRLFTHPTLRENYATPFLWAQIGVVSHLLRPSAQTSRASRLAALVLGVVLTTFFVLSWQFTPFVLLLQVAALYAAYLLGTLERRALDDVLLVHLLSGLIASAFLFFNPMLVTSLWILLALAIKVVTAFYPEPPGLAAGVMQGVLAVSLLAVAKTVLGLVTDDDGHIFKILRAKVSNFEDLMTGLYLCGPTYRGMSLHELTQLSSHFLVPSVGLIAAILAIRILKDITLSSRKPHILRHPNSGLGSHLFNVLQALLFLGLAFSIRRLQNIGVPGIALVAGLLVSHAFIGDVLGHGDTETPPSGPPSGSAEPPHTEKGSEKKHKSPVAKSSASPFRGRKSFVILVWVALGGLLLSHLCTTKELETFMLDAKHAVPSADDVNREVPTGKLMRFIQSHIPADKIVGADPVISCMVKLTTQHRIIIHPHVENIEIRLRHHDFFQIYNHLSEQDVHAILRSMHADYLVLANGPCDVACQDGKGMDHLANLADARGERSGRGDPALPQFCKYVRSASSLKYFKKVYHEPPFLVLQLL